MTARKKKTPESDDFIPCVLKNVPEADLLSAAMAAVDENPANAPAFAVTRNEFVIRTQKYWGAAGVNLGVAFLDGGPTDLQARILAHMNAWGRGANVIFKPASAGMAQVRITRTRGDGYWSYLGTDVLLIPRNQPTMNLDSFTMSTPDSEYLRVVRHETGHTLGAPHEHMRKAIIERLDAAKTIAYFRNTYGWSEQETRSNVLTPVEENAVIGSPFADETSIMAYSLPGSITKDGGPVVGGTDINDTDATYCAKLYPLATPPPPPPAGGWTITIKGGGEKPIITTE